jgi:predicted Zn-dependent peptidase
MVYTSKKYDTKSKIATIGEELYGSRISASFNIIGNTTEFIFTLEFLNPKYTEEKYLNESLDFLYEVIFNPNIEDNGFKKEYFDILVKENLSYIESIKDNPNLFASIEYSKKMYKGTPGEYFSLPSKEELLNATPQDLYLYYKKLFSGEFKTDIVVYGEQYPNIEKNIEEKFKNLKTNNDEISLSIKHKYKNEIKEYKDTLPYNQSKLYMGYRLNELDYHEMNHVLKVYNTILGTMNDSILFNIVREKNSLCYSIGSYYSKYNPSLTIYAGINKDNYEKTILLIKECMEMMKDEKVIESCFESAKKTINTYLNNYYDDCFSQINKYYYDQFEKTDDIETYRENINKVTIEEIIELNKKISLSTIYFLEGDNNAGKNIR